MIKLFEIFNTMILVWKQTKLPVLKFSPLDLLEDAEDLMFDTRKRRGPCVDLESSLEIGRKDLILAKKYERVREIIIQA